MLSMYAAALDIEWLSASQLAANNQWKKKI